MAKNNVFKLAGAHRDADTTALLDRLIEQDKAGEIVGIACVTFYRVGRKKQYSLSITGWAESNPTLAVGAMASCQALLYEEALQDAGLI